MKQAAILASVISATLMVGGCGKSDTSEPTSEPTPVKRITNDIGLLNNGAAPLAPGAASPGGSPTFGTQTGMGFSTGDASHSSGQGSGMMGYNGTGSMGTSHAISDEHPLPPPTPGAKDPVLPAQ